jgi:hypothetical protein
LSLGEGEVVEASCQDVYQRVVWNLFNSFGEIVRKHGACIEFLEIVAVLRSSAEEHNNGKRHNKSTNSKDFSMEDVLEGHLLRARLEYGPKVIYSIKVEQSELYFNQAQIDFQFLFLILAKAI